MWQEVLSHLAQLGLNGGMERRGRKEHKNKRNKKREFWRERHHLLLSRFPDDRTDGFRRSKRKSSSSLQGLHIKIGVVEFQQTLKGRGFLLLGYSCLKSHENGLGAVRPGMAMHSNPKKWDRMLDEGTILGQPVVRCGTVLHSSEMIFGLKLSMCIACMILIELNSMNCV